MPAFDRQPLYVHIPRQMMDLLTLFVNVHNKYSRIIKTREQPGGLAQPGGEVKDEHAFRVAKMV